MSKLFTKDMSLWRKPQRVAESRTGKDVVSGQGPIECGLSLIQEKKLGFYSPYLWPPGATLTSRHFWTLWVAGRLSSSTGQYPVEGRHCERRTKHTDASREWH